MDGSPLDALLARSKTWGPKKTYAFDPSLMDVRQPAPRRLPTLPYPPLPADPTVAPAPGLPADPWTIDERLAEARALQSDTDRLMAEFEASKERTDALAKRPAPTVTIGPWTSPAEEPADNLPGFVRQVAEKGYRAAKELAFTPPFGLREKAAEWGEQISAPRLPGPSSDMARAVSSPFAGLTGDVATDEDVARSEAMGRGFVGGALSPLVEQSSPGNLMMLAGGPVSRMPAVAKYAPRFADALNIGRTAAEMAMVPQSAEMIKGAVAPEEGAVSPFGTGKPISTLERWWEGLQGTSMGLMSLLGLSSGARTPLMPNRAKAQMDATFGEAAVQREQPGVVAGESPAAGKKLGEPKPEGWKPKAWMPQIGEEMPQAAKDFKPREVVEKQKVVNAAAAADANAKGKAVPKDPNQRILWEAMQQESAKLDAEMDAAVKQGAATGNYDAVADVQKRQDANETAIKEMKDRPGLVWESATRPKGAAEVQLPLRETLAPGEEPPPPAAPVPPVAAVPPTPPAPAAPPPPARTIRDVLNGPPGPTPEPPPPTSIVPDERVARGITQPGLPVGPEAVLPKRQYGKQAAPVAPEVPPGLTPEDVAYLRDTLGLDDAQIRQYAETNAAINERVPTLEGMGEPPEDLRQMMRGYDQSYDVENPPALEPPTELERLLRKPLRPGQEPPPAAAPVEPPTPPVAPAAPTAVAPAAQPPDSVQTLLKGTQPSRRIVSIPDASKIGVDAKTYQFKESDAQGVTGRLSGVEKWEENSPPVLLHERADGSLWVADGHQRVNLYNRLKAAGHDLPPLEARILREADGWDVAKVRRLASRLNIMEGSAKPLDIAKLLKTGPLTEAERATIAKSSTTGSALAHGEGLSKLSDEALQAVINGEAHPEAVSTVSKYFTDPVEQLAAVRAIGKRKIRGAAEGEAYAVGLKEGMMVRAEKGAQERLPWDEDVQFLDLVGIRAKLVTKTQRWLIERKAAFRDVLKRKGILEEAKFSMDEETGKALGEEAGSLLGYFKKYADQAGTETNAALRRLAQDIYAKRTTPEAATNELAAAIRRDIESGGGDTAAAPAGSPVGGRPDGAGRDGVVAPAAKPVPPVEPTATVAEAQDILRKGADALNKEAPPLADVPLTLTSEKATEGMPPPTKAELEAAGQTDMFAEPAAPKTEINASGESAASLEAQNRVAAMKAKGQTFGIVDPGGNLRPLVGPDAVDVAAPKGSAKVIVNADGSIELLDGDAAAVDRYNRKPRTAEQAIRGTKEEPTVPEVEAERPAVREAVKPAETAKDLLKKKTTYRTAPPEEYTRMVRARNAAMDAASQRGKAFVDRIEAVKKDAEAAYEQGGVEAVEKFWADVKAKIETKPATVKDWTPPERIGENAELIAPPNKDFVIVRFEGAPRADQRTALTEAGFRYDTKTSQWIGNTDAPTNRRGRPRADLIADAKRIAGGEVRDSQLTPTPESPSAPSAATRETPSSTSSRVPPPESKTPRSEEQMAEDAAVAAAEGKSIDQSKPPTIAEVAKKPDIDTPQEQTTISDAQQEAFDTAIEKGPEPSAPKPPSVETMVERPKTTLEQLPNNVRSFLKKQVKLTDDDINGMTVDEATKRGVDFGKEMEQKREQARIEKERAAANQPVADSPLDDVLSGAPLEPKVKQWAKMIEAFARGEEIDTSKYSKFIQDRAKAVKRAVQIRRALKLERKQVKPGEMEKPVADLTTVKDARLIEEGQELARRLEDNPDFLQFTEAGKKARGSYEDKLGEVEIRPSEREQYRQERERAALLEKGTPEALDRYAEMLAQLQDREHAVIVRNPLNEKRVEPPRRGPSGDLLGSGFAPLEGLIEMYKAKDPRFWDLMRVVGVSSGAVIGAMEDEEHPLRGALAGAMAGMTVAASTAAGRAQMARWARATKVLAQSAKGLGREEYKGTEVRRAPKANRDFNWIEAIAPMSVEQALPDAYRRITGILTDLNNQMAFGKLAAQTPEIQKSVAKNYMRRSVEEAKAIAKEFKDRGFVRKAAYMEQLASALGKKPTGAAVSIQNFIKGVTGREVSYDFVERHIGTNAYRLLTGYALGSALQNYTQPVLATRHVSLGDLKFGYKYARTEWGKQMTRHVKIHRPTDIAEDVAGISSQTNVEAMTGVKGWLADSQRLMASSDNFNRRVVYLAAMRKAHRLGLMGDYAREWSKAVTEQTFTEAFRTEANDYAMKIMRDTQGDVGPMAMNPQWRGPLMGSARPFLKYPTLLVRNLLDTAFQPDKRGRNRFIVTMTAAIVLGKQLGLDLEDTLLMGGKPMGLDLTDPGKLGKKVVSGDIFPAVKGAKDVAGHVSEFFGGNPMTHEVIPNSPGEIMDSDLAYWLLGRYPIQVGKTIGRTIESDIKPLLAGEERKAHKVRTPTGALNPQSALEDWFALSGFKSSRISERADVLSEARDATYSAQSDRRSRMADIKRELRIAEDSGNDDARRQLIAELAILTKSDLAVKNTLKGLNRTQYERLMDQASPAVRAMLAREYGPLVRETELK